MVRRPEPGHPGHHDGFRALVDAGVIAAAGRDLPGHRVRVGGSVDGFAVAGSETGAGEVFAVSESVV
ncbi:hypothetical protein G6F31_021637 [Rhizopus arrhizus]|nr:hypothetical protein G6F31_021637 [Rhizopus arrhizus]